MFVRMYTKMCKLSIIAWFIGIKRAEIVFFCKRYNNNIIVTSRSVLVLCNGYSNILQVIRSMCYFKGYQCVIIYM